MIVIDEGDGGARFSRRLGETVRDARYASAFEADEPPPAICSDDEPIKNPAIEALYWIAAIAVLGWLAWACLHGAEPRP